MSCVCVREVYLIIAHELEPAVSLTHSLPPYLVTPSPPPHPRAHTHLQGCSDIVQLSAVPLDQMWFDVVMQYENVGIFLALLSIINMVRYRTYVYSEPTYRYIALTMLRIYIYV